MTGESGANRTFRSLFGGQEKSFDEVLDLETDVIGSIEADSSVSGAAIVVAVNENKDEEEDGDDAMVWKEELLLDCGVAAKGNSLQLAVRLCCTRSYYCQFFMVLTYGYGVCHVSIAAQIDGRVGG